MCCRDAPVWEAATAQISKTQGSWKKQIKKDRQQLVVAGTKDRQSIASAYESDSCLLAGRLESVARPPPPLR